MPWIANLKLGCMNANRNASNARRMIVTRERPLTALVQPPAGGQRQRMRRDDDASAKSVTYPARGLRKNSHSMRRITRR